MQACCADGICFGKFKDIETHILEVDPQPLFSNIHINENGVCVPSVPLTKTWSEFLFVCGIGVHMNCLKRTMSPKWMLTVVDVGNSMLPGVLWTNTGEDTENET